MYGMEPLFPDEQIARSKIYFTPHYCAVHSPTLSFPTFTLMHSITLLYIFIQSLAFNHTLGNSPTILYSVHSSELSSTIRKGRGYSPKGFRTIICYCPEPLSNVHKYWLAMPLGAGIFFNSVVGEFFNTFNFF